MREVARNIHQAVEVRWRTELSLHFEPMVFRRKATYRVRRHMQNVTKLHLIALLEHLVFRVIVQDITSSRKIY